MLESARLVVIEPARRAIVPVAQRIEQQPSKLLMGVRFPPGTHITIEMPLGISIVMIGSRRRESNAGAMRRQQVSPRGGG